jgi:GAF domain-containing protein
MATDAGAVALPLSVDDHLYGVIYGDRVAEPILDALHQALHMLVKGALLQKSLAQETLERYREINLLYRVHEYIGASVDLEEVIERVLRESIRIIKAEGGSVLLADDLTDRLTTRGSAGAPIAEAEKALLDSALSEKVFGSATPHILNDLAHHVRATDDGLVLSALLCAPLNSGERVLGVIILGKTTPGAMFTAGDQKLLSALASQAGIAIANAREVQAREQRLRQQIESLRIEIDEAKKQHEVYTITESEYFAQLQESARKMRAEFDV